MLRKGFPDNSRRVGSRSRGTTGAAQGNAHFHISKSISILKCAKQEQIHYCTELSDVPDIQGSAGAVVRTTCAHPDPLPLRTASCSPILAGLPRARKEPVTGS